MRRDLRSPGHGPLRQVGRNSSLLKRDRLHHLPDETIGQQDDGIPVAIGQFESQCGQIGHLLRRIRRQHDRSVVSVAAALHHLVIIALFGCDVAESRTSAVISAMTHGSSAPAM